MFCSLEEVVKEWYIYLGSQGGIFSKVEFIDGYSAVWLIRRGRFAARGVRQCGVVGFQVVGGLLEVPVRGGVYM